MSMKFFNINFPGAKPVPGHLNFPITIEKFGQKQQKTNVPTTGEGSEVRPHSTPDGVVLLRGDWKDTACLVSINLTDLYNPHRSYAIKRSYNIQILTAGCHVFDKPSATVNGGKILAIVEQGARFRLDSAFATRWYHWEQDMWKVEIPSVRSACYAPAVPVRHEGKWLLEGFHCYTIRGSTCDEGIAVNADTLPFSPVWGDTRHTPTLSTSVGVAAMYNGEGECDENNEDSVGDEIYFAHVDVITEGESCMIHPVRFIGSPHRDLVLVQQYQPPITAVEYHPSFSVKLGEGVRLLAEVSTFRKGGEESCLLTDKNAPGGNGNEHWLLVSAPEGWAKIIVTMYREKKEREEKEKTT